MGLRLGHLVTQESERVFFLLGEGRPGLNKGQS